MSLRSNRDDLPFQEGDTVVVGLSGGADSVCLTHWLRENFSGLRLAACHINHQLRGEESDRDERFVEAFCEQEQIPLYRETVSVRERAKALCLSEEECGREVRYTFFEETAQKLEQKMDGRVWIATAHTQTDQAETVLFRLVRGSALKGLCGIPPVRGRIVRPLLGASREEIEAYCTEHGLSYVTDSTNLSCGYSRNRIRLQVLPELSRINNAAVQHIAKTAGLLAEDEEFLQRCALDAYHRVLQGDQLDIQQLLREPMAMRRRALALWLSQWKVQVFSSRIEELMRLCHTGGQVQYKSSLMIRKRGRFLEAVSPEKEEPYFEFLLKDGIFESPTGESYKIQTLDTNPSRFVQKIYKNVFDILIDCGKISGSIMIRQRRPGDMIRLPYRKCTKSVKKLFSEEKISHWERSRRFVLADRQGVIGVEGFGADERVCCDKRTTKAVAICWLKGIRQDDEG